jgi:hypothetical protein
MLTPQAINPYITQAPELNGRKKRLICNLLVEGPQKIVM